MFTASQVDQLLKDTNEFVPSKWLTQFLKHRGLKVPDKRPLYQYHINQNEYNELKTKIKLTKGRFRGAEYKYYAASFVLFCSEWYKREANAEWSWYPIWQVVGFEIPPSELANLLTQGLEKFWNRPIRFYESERRNFLGSIFSEGGLPFQLLKESNSKFQNVFSRILRQYGQSQIFGLSTRELVAQSIDQAGLPKVFSEETSVELIANMADELVSIVQLFALDTEKEPVRKLDLIHRNWRQNFPIPLDDATGTEFLNGLLCTASKERQSFKQKNNLWKCQHFLKDLNSYTLQAEIFFPDEVYFPLDTQPSTSRFELGVYEGDQQIASLHAGYATIENNQAKVRLRQGGINCKRINPNIHLTLVAIVGGLTISRLPIENSEIEIGQIPIGFELVNEKWTVCGQASFKTKATKLLLIIPQNATLKVDDNSKLINENSTADGYKSFLLEGNPTIVVYSDETYVIQMGCVRADPMDLVLSGRRIEWQSIPENTFYGIPTVKSTSFSTESNTLESNTLESNTLERDIFFSGLPISQCTATQKLGSHFISIRNKTGETLLRKRVGILPPNFKIEIKNGEKTCEGSIFIYPRISYFIEIENQNIKCQRINHDDFIELKLVAQGLPPSHVNLALTPNLERPSIQIKLPFPASGHLAFDKDGNQLSKEIMLTNLLGARLYLFKYSDRTTKFTIELSLKGRTSSSVNFKWHYTVKEKPLEISLFSLKEQIKCLFSLEEGIDQVVELRIFSNGTNSFYNIFRNLIAFDLIEDQRIVSLNHVDSQSLEFLRPVAMLLSDPERKPVQLSPKYTQGVLTGIYELPNIINNDGPWLIIPDKGDSKSFRPILISGSFKKPDDLAEIKSLQKATLAFTPYSEENVFNLVLNKMAVDPDHTGWQFIKVLYDNFGYLPLATFEVWRALMKNFAILAMTLFKFEMKQEFLVRLETEFPILWEFFPIFEIKFASQRFQEYLISKGIQEVFVSNVIRQMIDKLSYIYQAYNNDIANWIFEGKNPPKIPLPLMHQIILNDWYQQLLYNHKDDIWPEYGGEKMKQWSKLVNHFHIPDFPDVGYRSAVTYLPVFAAAVAAGKVNFNDIFNSSTESIFLLRQVRDFDSTWFNSLYQYSILHFLNTK